MCIELNNIGLMLIFPLPSDPEAIILKPWKEIWNGTQASA